MELFRRSRFFIIVIICVCKKNLSRELVNYGFFFPVAEAALLQKTAGLLAGVQLPTALKYVPHASTQLLDVDASTKDAPARVVRLTQVVSS